MAQVGLVDRTKYSKVDYPYAGGHGNLLFLMSPSHSHATIKRTQKRRREKGGDNQNAVACPDGASLPNCLAKLPYAHRRTITIAILEALNGGQNTHGRTKTGHPGSCRVGNPISQHGEVKPRDRGSVGDDQLVDELKIRFGSIGPRLQDYPSTRLPEFVQLVPKGVFVHVEEPVSCVNQLFQAKLNEVSTEKGNRKGEAIPSGVTRSAFFHVIDQDADRLPIPFDVMEPNSVGNPGE